MKKVISAIVFIGIIGLLYGALSQVKKLDPKSKRVECQNKSITFERMYLDYPAKDAIQAFKAGNYELKSDIEYSKYMESHLKNIMTVEDSNKQLKEVFDTFITENKPMDKKVIIDYYIYENDKKDPGKKGKKAKLYAGYLKFKFKYDGHMVYQIQTDYNDINGKDIKDRMQCAIKSFTTVD